PLSWWSCPPRPLLTSPPVTWPSENLHTVPLSDSTKRGDPHDVAVEQGLHRPVTQGIGDFFRGLVITVDREQLGFHLVAVNPRRRIAVDAGHRAAAQRAVDMDGAAGGD